MSSEISAEWQVLGLPVFAEYTGRWKGLQSQRAIVFRAGSGRSVLAAQDDLSRVLTDDQRIICRNQMEGVYAHRELAVRDNARISWAISFFCKEDGSPLNPDILRRDVLYPTLDRWIVSESLATQGCRFPHLPVLCRNDPENSAGVVDRQFKDRPRLSFRNGRRIDTNY
jgi:hypothetical protein